MSMHLRGSRDMMGHEEEGWWKSRTGLEQKLIILSTLLFILSFGLTISVIVFKNKTCDPCPEISTTTEAYTGSTENSTTTTEKYTGSTENSSTTEIPPVTADNETSPVSSTKVTEAVKEDDKKVTEGNKEDDKKVTDGVKEDDKKVTDSVKEDDKEVKEGDKEVKEGDKEVKEGDKEVKDDKVV